jgi:flavodoxin
MRVLILYETRRGFTLTVARAIRDELRGRDVEATAAPIRSVDAGTLASADALVVGSWVQGLLVTKVGPATGVLQGIDDLPELRGLPAATFCTCDVAPRGTLRVLAERLGDRGAGVVGGFAFKRKKSLRHVPAYVDAVLPALRAASTAATA